MGAQGGGAVPSGRVCLVGEGRGGLMLETVNTRKRVVRCVGGAKAG